MTAERTEAIGLFGGSFDPPHAGHVLAVHYLLLTEPLSRVYVVPCARHPFGKEETPFAHRCEMCRIAFACLSPKVQVLDIEGVREGPSYTIDSVRALQRLHPGARIVLIVGSDILQDLPRWRDSQALLSLVTLRALKRLAENVAPDERDQDEPYYLPRISSTALREMIAANRDVSSRIPRDVLAYIRRYGLYGPGP